MNRPSRPMRRRGPSAPVSVALGWLFALCALVSCCSAPVAGAGGHHGAALTAVAAPAAVAMHPVAAESAAAFAPEGRGAGSTCQGTSEHTSPVVLPGQSTPVALPGAVPAIPVAPLTGAAAIRGPSNDAVREVDHLRLQVQRI
ncbi:hypothetical protein [Streptomyces sp. NPDC052042]|uniref:hypothetical protein n=1 Tax=Streptomyces sp. NPDC052042 TaxID=3365683 RepID=UPI0037D5ACE9